MIGGFPFLAPFQSLNASKTFTKAVDVGCGSGIATLQLASLFPQASLYGLDISDVPEQTKALTPPNVTWVKGNVLDYSPSDQIDQIFTPESLDYIFGRMLLLGMSDWPRYISTAARALKPGGTMEHQDIDWAWTRVGTNERVDGDWEWGHRFTEAIEKQGLSTRAGSGAAELMRKEGLEVLEVKTFEFSFVPSERTPNSVLMGQTVQKTLVPIWPDLMKKVLEPTGMAADELERLTKDAMRDITSEEGLHLKFTVTVARKPL